MRTCAPVPVASEQLLRCVLDNNRWSVEALQVSDGWGKDGE